MKTLYMKKGRSETPYLVRIGRGTAQMKQPRQAPHGCRHMQVSEFLNAPVPARYFSEKQDAERQQV